MKNLFLALILFLTGCSLVGENAPLILSDAVIEGNAVWEGEVRVMGTVTVKKGGSLTILPGTKVVFEKIDRDGDGIGDSEVYVEGVLTAQGAPDRPILLTSGAEVPEKADWKFLYLDFAKPSVVEHLISEYAYSGIQVHFGQARVLNSEFRHNVDGVRFSTVNIEVAGNRIHDNTHGLRYEERRSVARIHHNEIRDNDIGIFVVTRSDDKAVVEENNITGSRQYQVKMGLEQKGDVTFPRNWWGTTDISLIGESFFGGNVDPALGRVHAPDPLPAPVEIDKRTQNVGGSR